MAAAAALALVPSAGPRSARAAGVVVEQIEAYEVDGGDDPQNPTRYAAIDFNGATAVTETTGTFAGITLHADATLPASTATTPPPTFSYHAQTVGTLITGVNQSPAYGFVSDLYAAAADAFLGTVVNVQETTGVAAAPGAFAGGASVINNSYVGDFGSTATNQDAQRRIDFMVARADVTFVAAAATGITSTNGVADVDPAVWSSFNALAVSGLQSFNPANSPGKTHADLSLPSTEASYGTAIVSGAAAGLVGQAAAAGESDATRGTVVRSLLMAGADKTTYARQTANNLSTTYGAGQPDYDASLAILQGGERTLATVTASAATTTPVGRQQGWTAGTVAAGGQAAVLFSSAVAVTGLTASLNWDVTSLAPAAGQIDTSTAAVIFPNLTLEVRPVTLTGGKYVLGSSLSDATFHSAATGDNVQYLYTTSPLAAGTYAFLIGGDSAKSTTVGFSYALRGSFASTYTAAGSSSWGTPTNWSNGIPNAAAAVATVGTSSSALTVTLDGDRRVGALNFTNAGGVTVAPGTGGTLTFDDAGDSTGTAAPTVTVAGGTQAISAPIALANGLTVNTAATSGLTLGTVTGSGGVTKTGAGTLTLSAAEAYGDTTVTGGTLLVAAAASVNGALSVTGAKATFAPATSGGVSAHTLTALAVGSGGTVALAPAAATANRTLLVTSALSLTGKLDVGNGDLIVHNGSLSALTAAAAAGFAGGTWTGTGLASTSAATDAAHLTAVGVVSNAAGLYTTFDGQPVATTDVLVRYTDYGDADLSGSVNAADYLRIDNGFANHLTGWGNGDFNYDGVVDGSDYTLMDNAFNRQAGSVAAPAADVVALPAATVAAVPEPASAGVIALAVVRLGRRRRRDAASAG